MDNEKLHPTVVEFKRFINNHPLLLREIRKTGRSWQEYYEKWILLGEEDTFWDAYKEEKIEEKTGNKKADEKNFELLGQLMKATENIDINKVQGQVNNLSKTIGTVQELINQFQHTKKDKKPVNDPFNWFRD
ncbi:YlbD family protein [Oceanobacillus bengalensis]|uniref:Cytosolic protein n=1 Tax=Oceanobacillus bengalensis TaxID=1435466 RepID=A0A494Z1I0_9BACI|nr:YlbD family protein [Oceanobacillus bengalensis]RKQ16329.1 hypothetical protein D8M05_07565 [Oceanobacillus bengalensis]